MTTEPAIAGGVDTPESTTNPEGYLRHDDVRIIDIMIHTLGGLEISLKNKYTAIVLNENLFRNNIHGVVENIDATNLPSNMGLCGQEFLSIKFSTPTGNEITKAYLIDKMLSRGPGANRQSQIYDLHFICPTSAGNVFSSVSKAYHSPIHQIVYDIFGTYLTDANTRTSSTIGNRDSGLNLLTCEETRHNTNIIIPGWSPLLAINWLASRAISKENEYGVDYVFYQDLDGFHFRSISSLYLGEVKQEYTFGATDSPDIIRESPDKPINIDKTFTNIRNLKINGYDTIKEARNGTFSSNVLIHDIIHKTYKHTGYDYFADFGQRTRLNKFPYIRNESVFSPNILSKSYFVPVHDSLYGIGFQVGPDTSIPSQTEGQLNSGNDSVAFWLPRHNAYKSHSKANSIEFEVSGDSSRRVGDVVSIVIPSFEGANEEGVINIDNVLSGAYLVTSIEHIITKSRGYQIKLKCCKDSMAEPLPSTVNDPYMDAGSTIPQGTAFA